MINKLIIFIAMIFITFIGALGSLFLKIGSKKFRVKFSLNNIIKIIKNTKLMLGVFLYGISSIFFIMILRITDLSIAYPMTSISYIFVTLLSYKILKEHINSYKILGITFIIIGVFLVNI